MAVPVWVPTSAICPPISMWSESENQKIERKYLTLRTRIKMNDIVIGLFVNRYEFCVLV
jgi:hypothetical protein